MPAVSSTPQTIVLAGRVDAAETQQGAIVDGQQPNRVKLTQVLTGGHHRRQVPCWPADR